MKSPFTKKFVEYCETFSSDVRVFSSPSTDHWDLEIYVDGKPVINISKGKGYTMALTNNETNERELLDHGQTSARRIIKEIFEAADKAACLLYTSPSPRDRTRSRMPSSA